MRQNRNLRTQLAELNGLRYPCASPSASEGSANFRRPFTSIFNRKPFPFSSVGGLPDIVEEGGDVQTQERATSDTGSPPGTRLSTGPRLSTTSTSTTAESNKDGNPSSIPRKQIDGDDDSSFSSLQEKGSVEGLPKDVKKPVHPTSASRHRKSRARRRRSNAAQLVKEKAVDQSAEAHLDSSSLQKSVDGPSASTDRPVPCVDAPPKRQLRPRNGNRRFVEIPLNRKLRRTPGVVRFLFTHSFSTNAFLAPTCERKHSFKTSRSRSYNAAFRCFIHTASRFFRG